MFNPFSLENKTILITGASSGIGRQCAIDCSKMGAKVVLIARNEERLNETRSMMEGNGHVLVCQDLTCFEKIPDIVKNIVKQIGALDGVLHCAGISNTEPLKLYGVDRLEEFFGANVFGAVMLTREICKLKNINKNGASIVFFASVAGIVGESCKSAYSMTKGALISGTRALAVEYSKKNIRVNSVSPGVIETPINAKQKYMVEPELRAQFEAKHLLGLGKTTDISNACIYLLSDASRWVTGQNLIVDGGYTVR
ncbi:MAG: SDR family oxidoreductase [Fibrobacteraceae bacterium]|nr:SDR family oxidoreductase [Fibrobacteraceae bacterium]